MAHLNSHASGVKRLFCCFLSLFVLFKEALAALDPEVSGDPMFYPDESVIEKTEVFITLPESTLKLQKDLWIKLKCLRDRPNWWPFPS